MVEHAIGYSCICQCWSEENNNDLVSDVIDLPIVVYI